MATLDYFHKIDPFWDDEYKHLDYIHEPFNEPEASELWLAQGYSNKFTGALCDMRSPQPSWNHKIVKYFADQGWEDIGTSYYRMDSGTILPVHQDKYVKYIQLFNLQGKESTIRRGLILLEDWASGHYLELDNTPFVNWKKGDLAIWSNDTPHMAANMGLTPRYTLQVTGHIDEDKQ